MTAYNIQIQSLQVENDAPMLRTAALALAIGLGLSAYFATIEFLLPTVLTFDPPVQMGGKVSVKLPLDKPKPKELPPKRITKQPPGAQASSGAKTTVRGNPRAIRSTSLIAILAVKTKSMNQDAYKTMSASMHQDLEKVLKSNARLITAGRTNIGERRGKADGSFDGTLGEGSSGGIGDVLGSLMGPVGALPGAKRTIGKMNLTNPGEIGMPDGTGGRSVSEIMQVVKGRTPGLRHIYNKYLKLHPGMAGKVTLRFTILAGGDVVECNVQSSTTQIADFDEDIREAVQRWTFKIIKAGNTTVAIPFNFSE